MAAAASTRSAEETLRMRRELISDTLSLSYSPNPLKIVRGEGQYLFDEKGNRFVDCVNNVAHVGHSHPLVTKAVADQLSLLNTNSRYLHDNIVDLAKQLTDTLPAPLRVCIFTNSGSEANDLALRICRTATGNTDSVIVGCAYHGHTAALIGLSPYKYEGKGGQGPDPTTHKAIAPDVYRGPYKASDPNAGEKYALDVKRCCDEAVAQGRKVAMFMVESIQSCGGQVFLPPGYLKHVYEHVHKAGGLCVADEVQTGFGRVGTHFWAFESQGVVPDIVTMGKPIGNGFPLSVVVTTPEIARKFNNGMEYFNTYGGNPVACAAGLAVMRAIREDRLQQNALLVGTHLKLGLQKLQLKHKLIGDVRGVGFFIGIELVRDEKLTPADKEAFEILQFAKKRGYLLSRDGPLVNVIKLKPPMCFSKENADGLLAVLDEAFTHVESHPSRL